MQPAELLEFLRHSGRDPSRLIFEDELTGVHNRRFLHSYLEHKVHWQSGSDYPLSVLMLDLDRFKEVNDAHGHAAGDQLLTWVASVLQDVAGQTGLPVRFGGDEFVVLLPATDRGPAQEAAARVLQRLRERPFRLRDTGKTIPVSVSIGVATAPFDANTSRELLQAADAALYHAKQSGRDQAATATEIDPHKVFPRTALHRLLVTGIAGRDEELRVVSEALLALGRGQNQFLLFEGADGMGKTTLLAAIGRSLTGHGTFAMARVACDQQEAYRPYYLATRILVALLSQRADQGADAIQSLTREEVIHLSQIVPQVGAGAPPLAEADEQARRRRIFAALARFVPRVVDRRPLVLILDDLQFADEATLLLLRALLQSEKLNLFVCGATLGPPPPGGGEAEAPPIERLYGAGAPEPSVQRLQLGPLTEEHIGDYLGSVFPNLRMPDGFEAELAAVTEGNPLFLAEVVRKLVADRKVVLVGPEWVIEPLPAGYLPGSLEEVVRERIAALDAEGRRLLEHAATLGKDVPVSMLAGSAALDENRVLEFVDRAEALGLVRTDFQVDDDVMRFLGKRVMDASYAGMDEARRAALHERIGTHQEALYQQHLLSSPSLLAHHFKQAANPEKAARYEQAEHAYARTVFDAEEAARYSVELVEEEEDPEARLTPQSVALVPNVIRTFMTAARSIQLYPPESKKTPKALAQLRDAVDEVLVTNRWLQLSQDGHRLRANGRPLDVSEWGALAASFRELLDRVELQSLTFEREVTESELRQLLTTLANTKPAALGPGFWKRMAAEQGLSHLRPEQVHYSQILRVRPGAPLAPQAEEEAPGPEELAGIPKILRALQSAAKVVRLYPPDAEPVANAVEQLHAAVRHALRSQRSLTLASVGHALLANGVRVDTTEYDAVAKGVVELLEAVGLESVTFRADLPKAELAAFVTALREVPPGSDRRFWDAFARNQALSGLALNQRRYAVTAVRGMLDGTAALDDVPTEAAAHAAAAERLAAEPLATLQQALPAFGKELLVTGEHATVRGLLRRLFEKFPEQDPGSRARAVVACRTLFDQVIFGLQHTFAELATGFLLTALATESAPQVLRELGDLLRAMAGGAVQFADYQLATRILLALTTRQRQLRQAGGGDAEQLAAATLDGRMDPAALRLLDEDVRSGQPERQEQAAKVLGALGEIGVPLLIDVIKGESDFRVRQLAARLVAEAGPVGAEQIKRALVTEVIVEQRARLLDVIDTVTPDLRHELQQCLHDPSPRVRRAAFQLFERLRRDDLIDLILPFAYHGHPAVARAAIRALAPLRTPAAVEALSSILQTTGDSRLAAMCCQALGRSEHPAAVDALTRLLAARRFLFFGRRWRPEVRATAAAALRQIPHPRAAELLARFAHDGDGVVRRLASGERLPQAAAAEQDEPEPTEAAGP